MKEFDDNFNFFYPLRTEALHFMPVNCGHQRVSSCSYRWEGLRRGPAPFWVWQYTLSGCGRVDFMGKSQDVPPENAFLLRIPEDHCYYLPEGVPEWEFLYFSFQGSGAGQLAEIVRARRGVVFPLPPDAAEVELVRRLLARRKQGELPDRYEASGCVYRFLMCLLRGAERQDPAERGKILTRTAREYVVSRMAEVVSVAELAEKCGCSRWHFSRRFHAESGCCPNEYIRELKMRHAARLLQTTRKSIKEIAEACGFRDVSFFCRSFRAVFKLPPGSFRNSGKGE